MDSRFFLFLTLLAPTPAAASFLAPAELGFLTSLTFLVGGRGSVTSTSLLMSSSSLTVVAGVLALLLRPGEVRVPEKERGGVWQMSSGVSLPFPLSRGSGTESVREAGGQGDVLSAREVEADELLPVVLAVLFLRGGMAKEGNGEIGRAHV